MCVHTTHQCLIAGTYIYYTQFIDFSPRAHLAAQWEDMAELVCPPAPSGLSEMVSNAWHFHINPPSHFQNVVNYGMF